MDGWMDGWMDRWILRGCGCSTTGPYIYIYIYIYNVVQVLYTGPMFQLYNMVLRRFPMEHYERFERVYIYIYI
jgi:hypothetical protein